jgi:hypothetical protein
MPGMRRTPVPAQLEEGIEITVTPLRRFPTATHGIHRRSISNARNRCKDDYNADLLVCQVIFFPIPSVLGRVASVLTQ